MYMKFIVAFVIYFLQESRGVWGVSGGETNLNKT